MRNAEIKQEIKIAKIPQWKLAEALGVCEMTFIRWLRKELTDIQKCQIRAIIKELKGGETIDK